MLYQDHAAESPQDYVEVVIVPGLPYGHILEQMKVCTKDLVCPVPHLLAATNNSQCPDIPRPWNIEREEVFHHVLGSLHRHFCINRLIEFVAFRRFQLCIKIDSKEEICTYGTVADIPNSARQSGGGAWREVISHHVPMSPAHNQLKYYDVWVVLLLGLHHKARLFFVK